LAELALRLPVLRRATTVGRLGALAPISCGFVAVVLWAVTVRGADSAAMGKLGLVTILGPAYFAGLVFVCGGFAVELLRPHPREGWLLGLVGVLILYLFGTASAVEPIAALTSSWAHAGFVRYVFVHGHPRNNFAAEFSWPGVFSLFALIASFMGKSNVLLLLRWFPFGVELAYLPAVIAIARASGVSRRAGWLGVALFYATDWIYQDYFSPQAINFLFYLVTIAVVLTCWRPLTSAVATHVRPALRERATATRLALRLRRLRGDEATSDWTEATVIGAFVVLCLVFVGSAMSHQLTPYAIVLALLACLLTRRLGRPELAVIAFLLAVGWLSLGASNYWLGHLSQIFGGIFQFGSTSAANVTHRVTGSASHRLIVDARILLTAGLFGLAAVGAARRATESRTLELLAIAPFFVLAAQSYGGEGLLRVALLSGPFAALLAASAIMPSRTGSVRPFLRTIRLGRHGRVLLAVAAGVVLLGSSAVTSVVRGGNDYYETFRPSELQAVNYTYHRATKGETIGVVAPYLPIGQSKVGEVKVYGVAANGTIPTQRKIQNSLLSLRPTFIVLGPAQQHWGEVLVGFKADWQSRLEKVLVKRGYKVLHRFGAATVLHLPFGGR